MYPFSKVSDWVVPCRTIPARIDINIHRGRVVVEHVVAGVKRCRIVKDVLHLTIKGISDRVMEIAAACTTCAFPVVTRYPHSIC
jgi:hypothetical protein